MTKPRGAEFRLNKNHDNKPFYQYCRLLQLTMHGHLQYIVPLLNRAVIRREVSELSETTVMDCCAWLQFARLPSTPPYLLRPALNA